MFERNFRSFGANHIVRNLRKLLFVTMDSLGFSANNSYHDMKRFFYFYKNFPLLFAVLEGMSATDSIISFLSFVFLRSVNRKYSQLIT